MLVLCPKKLAENRNTYKDNYVNNPIAADRLSYDVLFHTNLCRSGGTSNYQGCKNNGILVGVYKYSYAMTVQQTREEADAVLGVLDGRSLDFPVFYDLEHSDQRALGKLGITQIAQAFLERIEAAGYTPAAETVERWRHPSMKRARPQADNLVTRRVRSS